MLDALFAKILGMSLVSSVVICVVLVVRMLLKKAPKVISYMLWTAVLFRLLSPFALESDFSLLPQRNDINEIQYQVQDEITPLKPALDTEIPEQSTETAPQYSSTDHILYYGKYIWAVGFAVMIFYGIAALLHLKSFLVGSVPLTDNIYISDYIKCPFTMGLIKNKIYLPSTLSCKEQSYIILHEKYHVKRLDHITKAAFFIALSIHWFNPLVWIAFIMFEKDMEMSCDEAVINKLGKEVRADYCQSLLNFAAGKLITISPLAFGESDTKERIENLSMWKKPKIWEITGAAVLCLLIGICMATDPVTYRQVIHVDGQNYYKSSDVVNEISSDNREIGYLESVLLRTKKNPQQDFQGANLDIKYAGNSIYRSESNPDVIYLYDYSGSYIPFVANSAADKAAAEEVDFFKVRMVTANGHNKSFFVEKYYNFDPIGNKVELKTYDWSTVPYFWERHLEAKDSI